MDGVWSTEYGINGDYCTLDPYPYSGSILRTYPSYNHYGDSPSQWAYSTSGTKNELPEHKHLCTCVTGQFEGMY